MCKHRVIIKPGESEETEIGCLITYSHSVSLEYHVEGAGNQNHFQNYFVQGQ